MSSKRAFLVLAPESCGSHLVTDLLVAAGCHGASGGHVDWQPELTELGPEDERPWDSPVPTDQQPWDAALPTDQDPVVWRRSVPHAATWLELDALVDPLEARDYRVSAVVVTRHEEAAIRSQLKWQHARTADEARAHLARAYAEIFTQVTRRGLPFVVTSYEDLVGSRVARNDLLARLELEPPAEEPDVWDGNAKWLSTDASEPDASAQDETWVDTGFPQAWFPHPRLLDQEYTKRVRLGRERMARSRVIFGGLARDIETVLPSALARIDIAAEAFADHRVVIHENDSTDGTAALLHERTKQDPKLAVLSEVLGAPSWSSSREPARMNHMAACRNRVLSHALVHDPDFDFLIMLDLDLPRGFSYDGLAHAFGYEGWDWIGANGIAAPPFPEAVPDSIFWDAWAFRWPGDEQPRPFEEVNALRFAPGTPPVSVWSCFGGLAVYRMEALHSGARYSGDECEHVAFHRALRERGFPHGYLDPNLIVLYSGRHR